MQRHKLKLLTAAILIVGGQQAFAADLGTNAGTTVNNTATVSYTVNSVAQTAIANNPAASFKVDRKINVTVASDGNVNVTPKATGQVLTYTVTNTTNDTMDFALAATNGTGDNFDPSSVNVFVESGATVGYQVGEDTATFIDELAEDASKKVYVVSTIPDVNGTTIIDGGTGELVLTATAHAGGTAGGTIGTLAANDSASADDKDVVQNVWADAAGASDAVTDGKFSAAAHYTIAAAKVAVNKASFVLWDPVNLYTKPKAIPGAIMVYCIEVKNTGGTAATSVSISDPLDLVNLTYVSESIHVATGTASVTCDAATLDNGSGVFTAAAGSSKTDAVPDADGGDSGASDDGNPISTSLATLNATNGVMTTFFKVTVK
ncbi:MAG: hypothetical protein ABIR05_06245 [Luteimonas sp.]